MKIHYKHLTPILISLTALMSLTSCTSLLSSKMPTGGQTMQQTYNAAINGTDTNRHDDSLRAVHERIRVVHHSYATHYHLIKSNGSPIDNQFVRLPNPNIALYVYPHTAGSGANQTPIPGYTTVFPLYLQVEYAMPGEVIAY